MIQSIAQVGYAALLDEAKNTYGEIKVLEHEEAGGRNFSATPRGEVSEIYADGRVVIAMDNNDGYDIELELLDIIDNIEEDWVGISVNATAKTKAEFADGKTMPKFALLLLEDEVGGTSKMTIYPYCQLSKRPNKNSKTSEGTFDPQFPTVSIAARPNKNKLVRFETDDDKFPTEMPQLPTSADEHNATTGATTGTTTG